MCEKQGRKQRLANPSIGASDKHHSAGRAIIHAASLPEYGRGFAHTGERKLEIELGKLQTWSSLLFEQLAPGTTEELFNKCG